jgi:hypothetical protein
MKWLKSNFLTKIMLTLLFIFTVKQLQAETVQRWQDQHGQWHFGDAAATHDRRAQPVVIQNPISVVSNDHAQAELIQDTVKKTKQPKPNKNKSLVNRKQRQCENMRDKINQPQTRQKQTAARQTLIGKYEKQCVIGNYYGS